MSHLAAFTSKLQPKLRNSLLQRYASDYVRISEHSAAEESLRRGKEQAERAAEKAEAANRAKSEFLANMSHELRTPLNAIIGFTDIMKGEMLGPLENVSYKGYVGDINSSAGHLLEVINDILDLSKIEHGDIELNEEEVDVTKVVESCLTIIEERARRGNLKLSYDPPESLPKLWGEARRVKQILINLLSNSVKFTRPGGEISVQVLVEKSGNLAITVFDTGIGIAAEDMEQIMTPFGQAHTGLNRKYEGTGLGLPLSKVFVEMHGGALIIESDLDVGTAVCALFPASRVLPMRNA
ncbi:MAG: sensor histidine kinase [Dongiaceae bacterium]